MIEKKTIVNEKLTAFGKFGYERNRSILISKHVRKVRKMLAIIRRTRLGDY